MFRNILTFSERPVTADELMIADVMKKFFDSLCNRDVDSLVSLFHEDAIIGSQAAGRIVGRDAYEAALRKTMPHTGKIQMLDLLIRLEGVSTAVVAGFSRYEHKGKMGSAWRRIWQLRKEGEQWLIINSGYYPI